MNETEEHYWEHFQYELDREENSDWCVWGGHTTAIDECVPVYAGTEGYRSVCSACFPECVGMTEEEEEEWRNGM